MLALLLNQPPAGPQTYNDSVTESVTAAGTVSIPGTNTAPTISTLSSALTDSGSNALVGQWSNAEGIYRQDVGATGSGEIFGLAWNSVSTYRLIKSSDNGATWSVVNGTGLFGTANLLGMTQDSTGKCHLVWCDAPNGNFFYGRVSLSYTSGAITGFSLDTSFQLFPTATGQVNTATDVSGGIQIIQGSTGESIVYWITDTPGTPVSLRVQGAVCVNNITPAADTAFKSFNGTVGLTTITTSPGTNASSHNWNAKLVQIQSSRDLYLVYGPRDTGDNVTGTPTQQVLYVRLTASGTTWSVGTPTAIATESNAYLPFFFDAVGTENFAWIFYHDPTAGNCVAQISSGGVLTAVLTSFASSNANEKRRGFGALAVNSTESGLWVWFETEDLNLANVDSRAGTWGGTAWAFTTQTLPLDPFNTIGINVSTGWRSGIAVAFLDDSGIGPQGAIRMQSVTAGFPTSGGTTYNDSVSAVTTAADNIASQLATAGSVSETNSALDSVVGRIAVSNSLSESVTATDSLANTATTSDTINEVIAASDLLTSTTTTFDTTTEPVTAVDSIIAGLVISSSISETNVASDALVDTQGVTVSATDISSVTDSSIIALTLNTSDTSTVTDSDIASQSNIIAITDNAIITDSDTATQTSAVNHADNSTVSDSNADTQVSNSDISDSSIISDNDITTQVSTLGLIDTSAVSDTGTAAQPGSVDIVDTASITDSDTATKASAVAANDTSSVIDTNAALVGTFVNVTDNSNVSDTNASTQIIQCNSNDTISVTDSDTAVGTYSSSSIDTGTITDIPSASRLSAVNDIATITDSDISLQNSSATQTDSILVSDTSVLAELSASTTTDSAAVSDTVTTNIVLVSVNTDNILVTDSTVTLDIALVTTVDAVAVSDAVVSRTNLVVDASDASNVVDNTVSYLLSTVADSSAVTDSCTISTAFLLISDNVDTITVTDHAIIPAIDLLILDAATVADSAGIVSSITQITDGAEQPNNSVLHRLLTHVTDITGRSPSTVISDIGPSNSILIK